MKCLLICFVVVSIVLASDIVRYDPVSGGVANRVTEYRRSVDTAAIEGQPNTLINPVVPTNGLPGTWKVDGTNVVLMSAGESNSVVSFNQAQALAAKKLEMIQVYTNDQSAVEIAHKAAAEAIIKLTVDQLNTLRTNPTASLPAITYAQARNVFLTEYSNRMNQITQ
jgi:hypothetical protein